MDVEIPNLPGSLRLNSDLIAPALREKRELARDESVMLSGREPLWHADLNLSPRCRTCGRRRFNRRRLGLFAAVRASVASRSQLPRSRATCLSPALPLRPASAFVGGDPGTQPTRRVKEAVEEDNDVVEVIVGPRHVGVEEGAAATGVEACGQVIDGGTANALVL